MSVSIPNVKCEVIAHLLIDENFPHFGAPLQLVSDNSTENVNHIIKKKKNKRCFTIFNVTVEERLHRTMHNILGKRIADNVPGKYT